MREGGYNYYFQHHLPDMLLTKYVRGWDSLSKLPVMLITNY